MNSIASYWETLHKRERALIPKNIFSDNLRSVLLGFLAGDGSVQVRKEKRYYHYQLDFFPDDDLMKHTYIEIIEHLYKKSPSVRIRDNVFHVRLTSKTVVQDILEYAFFGLKEWSVPMRLLTTETRKCLWLKGFFFGEAYVGKNVIKIQTVNEQGMKEVSRLLFEVGVENKMYSYEPKKSAHSTVHIICINKKSARRIYFEKIGFFHSKKQKKLQESLSL